MQPLPTNEIVQDQTTPPPDMPHGDPIDDVSTKDAGSVETPPTTEEATHHGDAAGVGAKQTAESQTSTAQLSRQLTRAEKQFAADNLTDAYSEAMQVWQACKTAQNAGSPSSEWGDLRNRSERIMREIAARPSGGRPPESKPLVITGR